MNYCEENCFVPQALVGHQVPDFTATAIDGNGQIISFTLMDAIANKHAVIFFYPMDFTFVCPSEIIAFDKRLADFKAKNVEVIGISIDSHFAHLAWRNTPINQGGIGSLGYPLVSDIKHEICQSFGIESESGVAYRASFLVDKTGIVRHMVVNDLPLGRNIDEMLRMVDALQFHEKHGEVCPAGWDKTKKAMTASKDGVVDYLAKHACEL